MREISKYDDLVPFYVVCGCKTCSCSMSDKMVPNPAKYGSYKITVESSTTVDPKNLSPIEPF